MPNNDDFLTQVQLTACDLLRAEPYFTPTDGAVAIPIVSEVKEDLKQAIEASNPVGMIVIAGISDFDLEAGGGVPATKALQLVVRVREVRSNNKTGENCLRVAQKVALVLNAQGAAQTSEDTPARMGGNLTPARIERAAADRDGVIAWHVHFTINGGGLCNFTRRGMGAAAGSP